MKIIVLTLDYPPHRFIGAEIAIHRLVKALQRAGHKVQVRTTAEKAAVYDGVRAVPHKDAGLWVPDLVITNAGLGTRVRNLWPDTPRAIWAHNNQFGALMDCKEAGPDLLITNTHHMRDVFLSVCGMDSLVLYPPPDPLVQPLDAPPGDAVTLINGSREKGGQLLADLATLLPDRRFIVVTGGHGPQVQQKAPNVEVLPATRDLAPVWEQTGTLLVPSHLESYSMVGFEALQHGIPVIARALPGVVEALGPHERYTLARNAETWATLLTHFEAPFGTAEGRRLHVEERLETIRAQTASVMRRLEGVAG